MKQTMLEPLALDPHVVPLVNTERHKGERARLERDQEAPDTGTGGAGKSYTSQQQMGLVIFRARNVNHDGGVGAAREFGTDADHHCSSPCAQP